jgi:UDP-N-acetylmuramoyl-tripeptide--D-alanyl-D-alanine ligase
MDIIRCGEIVKAAGGTLICGSVDAGFGNISTDSRKIAEGDLFIPIVGERFDGHNFIYKALEQGAAGTLTHKQAQAVDGKIVIRVDDTLKALRAISAYYRQKFDIPLIGITGSVGKTTTKEMVASIMMRKFNVLKTEGNFNNEIGLPLTVLRLDRTHQAAVLEMGMSGFGEISRLTSIAKPYIAIITNIGMSHIEKLGSRENILKAKMEILEGLDVDGLVVLNGDDPLLVGLKGLLKFRTVFYGMGDGLEYRAENVKANGGKGTDFNIRVGKCTYNMHIPAPGIHNVHNALAAIAAGMEMGISMDEIIEGIASFNPGKMRLNIISHDGMKIINDVYNASPQSMEAAINVLKDMGVGGKTIAVLGDMLEMGEWACKAHMDIGRYLVQKEIDYIVTVGKEAKNIAAGAFESGALSDRVASFDTNSQAAEFVKSVASEGDIILVKGSRGMKMEEIVSLLTMQNA